MTAFTEGRVRARLLDADHPDRLVAEDELDELRLSERQLLWFDVSGPIDAATLDRLAGHLELRPRTRAAFQAPRAQPSVSLHGAYLHVRVAADPSEQVPEETGWLDVVAGRNLVATIHDGPVPFLAELDGRIERDASAGLLSAVVFFTAVIDASITTYHAAVDEVEEEVDRLDALLLRGTSRDELLRDLVRARRRIAQLRRLLADHRPIFTALASPETGAILDDPDAPSLMQGLGARYDGAMGAIEDSREALLGSFDIYMSRTAQRTNDVVKALTIVTVLLLPGSVLAGLLGMNVQVPLDKDDPMSFWVVVGALAVLAVTILVVARVRRWL